MEDIAGELVTAALRVRFTDHLLNFILAGLVGYLFAGCWNHLG